MPIPEHTINKVVYDGHTLLDLTGDTITPETVVAGYTGHDRSGNPFVGTYVDSDTKVTQINNVLNNEYRVILSNTATDDSETATVYKNGGLRFNPNSGELYIEKIHTATTTASSLLILGNTTADGTAGASYGVVRICGKSSYYSQIVDSSNVLTANRNLYIPNKSGTIAVTTDVSDAISGLATVATSGSYNDLTNKPTITDEKVAQANCTTNSDYCILLSGTADATTRTEGANKNGSLLFNPSSASLTLNRLHTGTSSATSLFTLGNSTSNGTAGASHGVLRIYGRNDKYVQFVDSSTSADQITANRNYYFPDASGTLALKDDIPTGYVTSVEVTGSSGISISGSPITSSGTITVSVSTASGSGTRNTSNTSSSDTSVTYRRYGKVVTITGTVSPTTSTSSKVLFTGLPKAKENTTLVSPDASYHADTIVVNTSGQIVIRYFSTNGIHEITGTYISE